jgi:enoyl-CoA hydratase/carnithine racemase
VTAEEGLSLGFVTRVVEDLETAIEEIVVTVGNAPRGAVADLLPLLSGAEAASRHEQAEAERDAQVGRLRALLGGG